MDQPADASPDAEQLTCDTPKRLADRSPNSAKTVQPMASNAPPHVASPQYLISRASGADGGGAGGLSRSGGCGDGGGNGDGGGDGDDGGDDDGGGDGDGGVGGGGGIKHICQP